MIRKNGRYVININDFIKICKFFELNPNNISVKMTAWENILEYHFYDIFTDATLFVFYNHDGKIRVKKNSTDFYEESIDNILGKNPTPPNPEMLAIIKKLSRNTTQRIKQKIDDFVEKSEKE